MKSTMKNKVKKTEKFLLKLKEVARRNILRKRYERALVAVEALAEISYTYNQYYTDDEAENLLNKIADSERKRIMAKSNKEYKSNGNTIVFYDYFGLDLRGWAYIYLTGLKNNSYNIIYITTDEAKNRQPSIQALLKNAHAEIKYISFNDKYENIIFQIYEILCSYRPEAAFFYTVPYDVAGWVAFKLYDFYGKRYLIDLTDHAFWLGTKCNDFFIGVRDMSAYIEHFERKIPQNRLVRLPVNLVIDEQKLHDHLPFDVENTKYIFSGGALYKTKKDEKNTFFRIVEHILANHVDIKFLYAGYGDDRELQRLAKIFPWRVFHIGERRDFYYLIKHCVLYLNTYPMFGGMMMQYAAYAGKIPITLRHNSDSDGLLLNQEAAKIAYDSFDKLVKDVDKLLDDDEYRTKREELLKGTIVSEVQFAENLKMLIETQSTNFHYQYTIFNTKKFQEEFLNRFNLNISKESILNKRNVILVWDMPGLIPTLIKKVFKKIFTKESR